MLPLKFGSLAKIHSSSPHGTCENTPPSGSKAPTIYPRFRALPELGYFRLKTSPGDRRLLTGLSLYELEIYTGRDTLGLHLYTYIRCVFEIQTDFLRSSCFYLQEILLRGRCRGAGQLRGQSFFSLSPCNWTTWLHLRGYKRVISPLLSL